MATKRQAQPEQAEQVVDEHAGHGGSYVLDPVTGKRTLVERTEDRRPQAPVSAPTEKE